MITNVVICGYLLGSTGIGGTSPKIREGCGHQNVCKRRWVWSPCLNLKLCMLIERLPCRWLVMARKKLAVMAHAVEASGYAWRTVSGIGGKLLISERSKLKSCLLRLGPIIFGGNDKIINFLRSKSLLARNKSCTRHCNV